MRPVHACLQHHVGVWRVTAGIAAADSGMADDLAAGQSRVCGVLVCSIVAMDVVAGRGSHLVLAVVFFIMVSHQRAGEVSSEDLITKRRCDEVYGFARHLDGHWLVPAVWKVG